MIEAVNLLAAFLAGMAIGGFFFAGLWWTVRHLTTVANPGWLVLASFVLRMGAVIAIFFLLFRDHGDRLVAALAGFVAARAVCIRWLPARASKEGSNPERGAP